MNIFFKESHGRCFGTYPLQGQSLLKSFKNAYDVGYRLFDTAQWYENEADLGYAIKKFGIPRSEIFITTKVHPHNYTNNLFVASVEKSLKFFLYWIVISCAKTFDIAYGVIGLNGEDSVNFPFIGANISLDEAWKNLVFG